jgi:HKD family nuclease
MKNNLIDELFDKSKTYRMGILCTYSLNIDFLENYLLKLNGLSNCGYISIFTDRKIYNSLFDINKTSKPRWINKRYLLTPIDVSGVFHPKLYLLASDKEVRIGIGSANLTREGLAGNLEITSVFSVTNKDKSYIGLLIDCLKFLRELTNLSGSEYAKQNLEEFVHYIEALLSDEGCDLQLLHNINDSIMSQIEYRLSGNIVNSIYVISPFFDKELAVYRQLAKLYPDADISMYIQQSKSNFPVSNYKLENEKAKIHLFMQQDRFIHGKGIIFKTSAGLFLLSGSANFTNSALMVSSKLGNIEIAIWGKITDNVFGNLLEPAGYQATFLTNILNLKVTLLEDKETGASIEVDNWLIESSILNDILCTKLNGNLDLLPLYLIINDNIKCSYDNNLPLDKINKSEILYIHVEGNDLSGNRVRSSKIWVINLFKHHDYSDKKKYYVSNPDQLTESLKDIINDGTEQDLIDYLLLFNIPLELVLKNINNLGFRPLISKGNVFGELISQKSIWWKSPSLFDAVKYFLESNFNKLCIHYDNIQLDKLGNFILIFGTIFCMMEVINDYIVSLHFKNPINADDWRLMRGYYDLFLKYIHDTIELLCINNNNEYISFEETVNGAIREDQQNVLGSIRSFREYLQKMGYSTQMGQCCKISKKIIYSINRYIEKGKIQTGNGSIVNPVLSSNGINDQFILERGEINIMVDTLSNLISPNI